MTLCGAAKNPVPYDSPDVRSPAARTPTPIRPRPVRPAAVGDDNDLFVSDLVPSDIVVQIYFITGYDDAPTYTCGHASWPQVVDVMERIKSSTRTQGSRFIQ